MTRDRHANAYAVLLDDRSRLIETNYRGLKDPKEAHAAKDRACLQCHSMDADQVEQGNRLVFEDGVGCERCHGPAQKWLSRHFTRAWDQKSDEEKKAMGFRPLKDLANRGRLCVECHVGKPGQEVDHDLIAAGHPRLTFEYAAYLDLMPPHWSRAREKNRHPDLAARTWAIGQIMAAQQSLALLAHRARARERPWPEFAEYDCFACHHGLTEPSRRQKQDFSVTALGSPTWGTWQYSMLPGALSMVPDGPDVCLDDLAREMAKPTLARARVADKAEEAARRLSHSLEILEKSEGGDAATVQKNFHDLVHEGAGKAETWDGAMQSYLGLAALYNALVDLDQGRRDPHVQRCLKELAKPLRFPPGRDSPSRYDRADFARPLRELQDRLPR